MEFIIALILLVILLILGVPIPFGFLATAIYLILYLGYDPSFLVPYGFGSLNNTLLLTIPLFILAGELMESGGIAKRLINFINLFVGKIKGGLGIATVIACAVFGAISGSATAALTSIGRLMHPRLVESGYSRGFAAALVSSSSILSMLIPPSIVMILYAWMGNQSVLATFLATIGPGLILVFLLSLINVLYFNKRVVNYLESESVPEVKNRKIVKEGLSALPAILMPIIILGGIYGGIMTPTEAAAVVVVYAIPVGLWVYKQLTKRKFFDSVISAANTTGIIMVMIYGIMILSRIVTMENVPKRLTDLLLSITDNTIILLLLINLILIVVGMFMDDTAAVLLATPILLPIVVELGIDPVHFAAIIAVNLGVGLLTPPAAPILYLGGRVTNTKIKELLKPTFVLILFAWLPTLIITTYIPEVALFLPKLVLN